MLERDRLLKEARSRLQQAQQCMSQVYNKHHRDRQFNVGDWVYLKLQSYRQFLVDRRSNAKFAAKYFGPFKVLKKIGLVAYLLDLPTKSKLHPVVHVLVVKPHVGQDTPVSSGLPEDFSPQIHPQTVLEQRRRKGIVEILVHWVDYSPIDATWENKADFVSRFPKFTLEDKGILKRGGMLESSSS